MDENMNPELTPELTPENETAENTSTQPEADTDIEESADTQESEVEESDETTIAGDAQNDGEQAIDKLKKSTKRKGTVVALVLIIVLLLAATAGLVFFMLNSKSSKLDLNKTVLTVGDVENSAAEYFQVYSYYSAYAMYYGYTEDQIKEYTQQQLVFVDTLYSEALKAGYELTDENNAEIDEQMNTITVDAEAASMSVDEYLSESVCKGYTMDMLRSYIEKQYIAQLYYNDKIDEIEGKYSGDDAITYFEAEYKQNVLEYDMADVSYWYFDSTEDDAEKKANEIVAEVTGGTDFTQAVKKVTGDDNSQPNDIKNVSYSTISQNFSEDAADWIYEKADDGSYKNGKGAITKIEVDGVVYVIFANNAPERDNSLPVTVDYIKVSVSTDTSVKTEDELKIAAKSTATKILNEFNEGDTSVAMFKKLSAAYDQDDNELVEGDAFEDITPASSLDSAIIDWAFDENRKVGDCELVEGDGCFYILYYTSVAETPLWQQTVMNSLISKEVDEWSQNIETIHADEIVADEEEIAKIIAFISESAQN